MIFFFFKQKTAYEMRISDWSSDVCSSDLRPLRWVFSFPDRRKRHTDPLTSNLASMTRHFLNTQDWTRAELDAVLAQAASFKHGPAGDALKGRPLDGKSIALVFFNPSLRTRTSFELGAFQPGGHAVVLQPGKDAWPIEFDLATVMAGDADVHIPHVAQGLGRSVHMTGVRTFPEFVDWSRDRQARVPQDRKNVV